jgi:hypothetical protein
LTDSPGVSFKAELVTGSAGQRLTNAEKESKMEKALRCNELICGFSINSKNAADLNFPLVAQKFHTNIVVWVRSNVVAHAFGLYRSDMLTHGPCHTNNVRVSKADICKLPDASVFPLRRLEKDLKKAALYHAINLGAAYNRWQDSDCKETPQQDVYEIYYESLLADKERAMHDLFAWLGHSELAQHVPRDKTVKSTPAGLRGAISNFDEVHTWLENHAPCLVSHLESNGIEVMPPCPLFFDPLPDTHGLFDSVARSKDSMKKHTSDQSNLQASFPSHQKHSRGPSMGKNFGAASLKVKKEEAKELLARTDVQRGASPFR